jgi:hypothetical protein
MMNRIGTAIEIARNTGSGQALNHEQPVNS